MTSYPHQLRRQCGACGVTFERLEVATIPDGYCTTCWEDSLRHLEDEDALAEKHYPHTAQSRAGWPRAAAPDASDDQQPLCAVPRCGEPSQPEFATCLDCYKAGLEPIAQQTLDTVQARRRKRIDDLGERSDPVNHPDHYQSEDGIECIDAIRAALGLEGFVSHCRGTALKYAWRSGKKASHAEDLRKACVYLTWAAEALEERSDG